jgi:hypothetical protein
MKAGILVTARSANAKTGDVPQVWVGTSRAESLASCEGCPQLADGGCYAQFGTPAMGHASAARAPQGIVAPILGRAKTARMLRVGAIGDPARANRQQRWLAIRTAVEQGLAVVGYTHFSGEAQDLRGTLMASCESLERAHELSREGWRAAIVMPSGTVGTLRLPDGSKVVECPAIAAERLGCKPFTCNDCASTTRGALCDASRPGPHVYFADHGPKAKRRLRVLQGS